MKLKLEKIAGIENLEKTSEEAKVVELHFNIFEAQIQCYARCLQRSLRVDDQPCETRGLHSDECDIEIP